MSFIHNIHGLNDVDNFRVSFGHNKCMTFTPKQKQIFDFVTNYTNKKGFSPTHEEIGKKFELAVSTIHEHLSALERKGYIKKDPGHARTIQIITQNQNSGLVKIPLLGAIAAGQPIETIQTNETIAVPRDKVPSGNIYALKVVGNSMIDENINDGDIVLVREQSTADNGQKVVALINNSEATLKKFYKERGHIRLQPANKNMEPIIIRNGKDISVQGIVLDVIREMNYPELAFPKLKETKQYDKLPTNKIILGDATAELKKLPNESCDIIIIDPPYNIGKDFGNNIDKRELTDYVSWSKG